jgi:branched-chain amino acid transport system ATP-binding protein
VGGAKSIWGVLVGTLIIFGLTPLFFQDISLLRNNSWIMSVISGVLIIVVVMFYKGGIAQLFNGLVAKAKAKYFPGLAAQKAAEVVATVPLTPKAEARLKKYEAKLEALKEKDGTNTYSASKTANNIDLPADVVLRLDDLCMYFGGLKAVDSLSFDVKKNEIFGLIGPNGAGKTTVFNCITQFYKPNKGEVWFRAKNNQVLRMNSFAVHDVIKTGIVRTFQNIELVYELTVLENILIAAHTQYHTGVFAHMFASPALRVEHEYLTQKALRILEDMNLLHLKDAYPVGMPYGVLKRIELARTLMANASLIILDEPAAGLNERETEELTALITNISKDYEVTIFLVEHDMGLVMTVCDHICAISFGKKLAYGTPKEIQASKDVQEAYLGVE